MKILNLYSENIKKIKAIDITPDGDTVIISGKNGNGKSSALDSIAMVLGGKKLIPSRPVRDGETTAKITVDLGDYRVTRHWTSPETSYLKLETKDGANITNAQGILNRFIGDLSFDPLEFSTMEPAKRFDVLRRLTKVDFTDLNKEHDEVYSRRTEINREGKALAIRLENEFDGLPNEAEDVDNIEEIKAQRKKAVESNNLIEYLKSNIERKEIEAYHGNERIKDLRKEIDRLNQDISNVQKQLISLGKEMQVDQDRLPDRHIDLTQFDDKIEKFYEYQKAIESQNRKKKVQTDINEARSKWEALDAKLKEIAQSKKIMISEANMPIEGLSFGEKEILYNDIPFAQLSTSEQIQVSISIAIAMNPKLRVAMIYGGSMLDEDAMKKIAEIAAERDVQIWIERVADKPDGNSIFIEDGEIKQ